MVCWGRKWHGVNKQKFKFYLGQTLKSLVIGKTWKICDGELGELNNTYNFYISKLGLSKNCWEKHWKLEWKIKPRLLELSHFYENLVFRSTLVLQCHMIPPSPLLLPGALHHLPNRINMLLMFENDIEHSLNSKHQIILFVRIIIKLLPSLILKITQLT